MKNIELTNAYIKKSFNGKLKLEITPLKIRESKKYPYSLIIQSFTEDLTKLTIYPVNKKKILKIIVRGQNVSKEDIEIFSEYLRYFDIIHTSGLVFQHNQLFYECYLNLSLEELESFKCKDLKTSLEKIKKLFKDLKIEEIRLKKDKD